MSGSGRGTGPGSPGSRFRRHASAAGGVVERRGRRLLGRVLDLVLPVPPSTPQEEIRDVRSVLLVRPNFRLGNALVTSPLVGAVRERFPGARVDYLGGEGTFALLDGLPIDAVHVMSRGFVLRPWRFVALFARLRRARYDVALECALGSFSGGLYTWLSGARYRIGVAGPSDRFLNVRVAPAPVTHVYDGPVELARRLGVGCRPRPVYVVQDGERRAAAALLAGLGLADLEAVRPFVALFVGGHRAKRWPLESWTALADALSRAGVRVVVCAGPEEAAAVPALRERLAGRADVVAPLPLRVFAALLSHATLVVTPDSGPMHLAAALDVPVVAVLAREGSTFFPPRGPDDRALLRPSVEEVAAAVTGHERVRALVTGDARVKPVAARALGG
jgi:heptosyltransferase-3